MNTRLCIIGRTVTIDIMYPCIFDVGLMVFWLASWSSFKIAISEKARLQQLSSSSLTSDSLGIDFVTSRRRPSTGEEELIADLFRGYDTDARAVVNVSTTVTVKINYMLMRIQRLDERTQVLTTTALLLTDWQDERLVWDPIKYNNISDIVVRANRIWIPELAIINGAEEMIQEFEKIRVLIKSDGSVHWEPGGVFTTTCDINIHYFPFDTQECPIEIGAWAYTSSRMNLTSVSTKMEIQEFRINGEWHILDTMVQWKEIVIPGYTDTRYSKVVFTIRMSRRYTFYLMNIIVPCSQLSVLILVVFLVPPEAGEKISVGISVLLAFTVFLLMLADSVPRTSLDTPILVIYLGTTMGLGTASVCLTVLVLNFHYRTSYAKVPNWVRTVFLQHGARILGIHTGAAPPVQAPPKLRARAQRNSTSAECGDVGKGGVTTGLGRNRTTCCNEGGFAIPTLNNSSFRRSVAPWCSHDIPFGQGLIGDCLPQKRALQFLTSEPLRLADLHATGGGLFGGATAEEKTGVATRGKETALGESLRTSKNDGESGPAIEVGKRNGRGSIVESVLESGLEGEPEAIANTLEDTLKDWQLLARVMDRIFFFVVSFLMCSSAMLILLSPWYNAQTFVVS